MKHEFSAGVVVYYQSKATIEYLLLHYTAGHWDFPKGHIEQGETKEQAALRELKEEAGLEANLYPDFLHEFTYIFTNQQTKELIKKTVYFFIGKTNTKEVNLSYEHSEFAWLEFEQALHRLTFKNAQELLKEVNKFIKKGK